MDQLKEIYNNVRSVPGYTSKINEFLRQNNTSSLFRQVRHKFPRRRIIVHYPFQMIMSDTINYRNLGSKNKDFKYIMIAIDVFSKKVWFHAMKRMNEFESTIAIEKILDEMPEMPQNFVTDLGTEYYNYKVKSLFDRMGIKHYSIRGKHKACVAERVIKTIKGRLQKYFWENNTSNWINVIDQFVLNYNATYHRSIKMSPNDVNENNRSVVFHNLYPKVKDTSPPRLKAGDRVRLLKTKNIFEKGYTRSWSTDIYKIVNAYSQNTVDFYRISDLEGNILPRTKYYWEINLVTKSNDN